MFILYFYGLYHEYHVSKLPEWAGYKDFRPGEGFWLVPGTDPDDDAYWRDHPDQDEDESVDSEDDETLEYICELLEAHEIEPGEFRRQMRNEGYDEEVIRLAIRNRRPDYMSLVDAT